MGLIFIELDFLKLDNGPHIVEFILMKLINLRSISLSINLHGFGFKMWSHILYKPVNFIRSKRGADFIGISLIKSNVSS